MQRQPDAEVRVRPPAFAVDPDVVFGNIFDRPSVASPDRGSLAPPPPGLKKPRADRPVAPDWPAQRHPSQRPKLFAQRQASERVQHRPFWNP
jgi:hypothetical protein